MVYIVHTLQQSYKIGLTKLGRWRTHNFFKFTRLVISRAGNRPLVWICLEATLLHSSQPEADLSLNSLFFALFQNISSNKKALVAKVLKAGLLKGRVNMRINQYLGIVPGFHFPRILLRANCLEAGILSSSSSFYHYSSLLLGLPQCVLLPTLEPDLLTSSSLRLL